MEDHRAAAFAQWADDHQQETLPWLLTHLASHFQNNIALLSYLARFPYSRMLCEDDCGSLAYVEGLRQLMLDWDELLASNVVDDSYVLHMVVDLFAKNGEGRFAWVMVTGEKMVLLHIKDDRYQRIEDPQEITAFTARACDHISRVKKQMEHSFVNLYYLQEQLAQRTTP